MDDDLRTSDLSSPATNGSPGGSASAFSVAAVDAAFAGGDEKKLTKVTKRFLVAEINRLVEENQQLKAAQEKYHEIDKKLVEQHRLMQVRTPPRYKFWSFVRPSNNSILRIALLAVAVAAGAGAISNFDAAVFKKGTANIQTKPSNVPASALPDAVKPPSFSVEPKWTAVHETAPVIGVQTEAVETEPFSADLKSQNTVTSFDDDNLAKQPEAQISIDGQRSSNLAPAAAQQGQRDLWSAIFFSDNKASVQFLNRPKWREAAFTHNNGSELREFTWAKAKGSVAIDTRHGGKNGEISRKYGDTQRH